MPRWLAFGSQDQWADLAAFDTALRDTGCWRVSNRTTVTSVIALADGGIVIECHGADRAEFDGWMQSVGFVAREVTEIRHIARTGEIWAVAKS